MRQGLVTRSRSQDLATARSWWRCRPRAARWCERLIPIAKRLEATASAGLPAKELAVVKRALRRMYDNLTNGRRRTR